MLSTLTLVSLSAAAAPPKLAMPAWTTVQVTPELAAFYADHLAAALRSNGIEVVTSSEMATLLGIERQKQLLGCADDSSCMAELGNALGAQTVLKVSVARLDESLRANITVMASLDGAVKGETQIEAANESRFFSALDDAAAELARKLTPEPPKPQGRVRAYSWVPAAVGGLGLVLGTVGLSVARVKYGDLSGAQTYEAAAPLASEGKAWQGLGVVGFVFAGAGAAAAVLMYVLGGPSAPAVTPSVGVTAGGASFSLGGSF